MNTIEETIVCVIVLKMMRASKASMNVTAGYFSKALE